MRREQLHRRQVQGSGGICPWLSEDVVASTVVRSAPRSSPVPRALLALAIGAFGIGTTEFVVMGMLPEVADGLGVSVSAVGLLISAYAIGVVVGAPRSPPSASASPRGRRWWPSWSSS